MELIGTFQANGIFHVVEYAIEISLFLEGAQGAGIQVTKVNARNQTIVHTTHFHNFFQCADLINFSHNLRAKNDIAVAGLVQFR